VLTLLASSFVAACGPISGSGQLGGVNPLGKPGGPMGEEGEKKGGLQPGQFVKARIDGTAFFNEIPKGDATADQLLDQGTPMKVIESSESFTKVELDSGVIGFVLTVVLEPDATEPVAPTPKPQPKPEPKPQETLPAFPPSPLYQ